MTTTALKYRLLMWVGLWLSLSGYFLASTIAESRASDDPSATAWMAFLPFVVPIFLVHGFVCVAPLAVIGELAIRATERG